MFICALIPFRFTIEKWAFGKDENTESGCGDVEGQNGDNDGVTKTGCDKAMEPLYQSVFGTSDVPGVDRARFLEILDPLVKS